MKNATIWFFTLLCLLLLSCTSEDGDKNFVNPYNTTISPPSWLLGTWKTSFPDNKMVIVSDDISEYINLNDAEPSSTVKATVKHWLDAKEFIEVEEQLSATEYIVTIYLFNKSGERFINDKLWFKRISETKFEYNINGTGPGNFITYNKIGGAEENPSSQDNRFVGIWLYNGGSVKFTGTPTGLNFLSATQTSINSGWYYALQNGFVQTGDSYIKNLQKISTNKFKCTALWRKAVNGVITEVKYGTECTVEFSANGQELTLTGESPFNLDPATVTLTKM